MLIMAAWTAKRCDASTFTDDCRVTVLAAARLRALPFPPSEDSDILRSYR